MRTLRVGPGYIKRLISEEKETLLEHQRNKEVLLREYNRLRSENYDRVFINEQLLDIAKELGVGFWQGIKFDIATAILDAIGFDPDGLFAQAIAAIFEEATVEDMRSWFKPGGCDNFSEILVDAMGEQFIMEPMADAILDRMGINPDSRIYRTSREYVTNKLNDADLLQGVQDDVTQFICSFDIGNIFGIFKDGLFSFFGGGKTPSPAAVPAPE